MNFRYLRYINNYQKLQLLLFFHHNSSFRGSYLCLAQKLYIADHISLELDIQELSVAGLLEFDGYWVSLNHQTAPRRFIAHIAEVYDDPLDRQIVLDMLNRKNSPPIIFETRLSHATK